MNYEQPIISESEILKPYRQGSIRFLQLILTALVFFGSGYSFNNPQALQQHFQDHLRIDQIQFNLLYTIVAFPNIFTTFFIGFLIDFLGVRIGIVSLACGSVLFQLIVAGGAFFQSYKIILVGRALLGIAAESIVTAQATMVTLWFKGKQLAFALGIAITFPQLSNALNSYLTPIIYSKTQSLGIPLLFSVFICLISVACALGAAFLDLKADIIDKQNKTNLGIQCEKRNQSGQRIKVNDLKYLKGQFWLIVVLCMFAISQYIPFMDNVNRMFTKRFCLSQVIAGKFIMITYIVAAGCSAPLGIIIDKIGFKRYFIMACFVIFFVAQGLILIWPTCVQGIQQTGPIAGLVLIGIGYGFYANSIVASIPLVCKKKMLGTAFGIMGMTQSLAQAFIPLLSGWIEQSEGNNYALGYRYSSLFFTLFALVGFLLSLLLLKVSNKNTIKLDQASIPLRIKSVIVRGFKQNDQKKLSYLQWSSDEQQRYYSQAIKHQRQDYNALDYNENKKYSQNLKQPFITTKDYQLKQLK